ncbi:MAG TPA: hypothetical protein VIB08_00345, partial [Thermoanaerobaculia bacterium]
VAAVLVAERHGQQEIRHRDDPLGREALRPRGTDAGNPGDGIAEADPPRRGRRRGQGASGE